MSASRRDTDTRGQDGRTAADHELDDQAVLQRDVLKLLRWGLKSNFTGRCSICLHFEKGAYIKSTSSIVRRGIGKLGPIPEAEESQLAIDLQKLAIDVLTWGTTKDLWGQGTIEMHFRRGRYVDVETTMTKTDFSESKKRSRKAA